jgi:dTDP-4-amino-4,6-dideoxygalactose transaminase
MGMEQIVRPKRKNFLVFGSPKFEEAEIQEVVATLRGGWIGTGPRVTQFEEGMKEYTGARHAVAVNSCTAALHLSLLVLGVGAGDEVITTPMTFAATANAIVHTGARPVFVDIDREMMLLDAKKIERVISPRTKVILPVHLTGRLCPMDDLLAIAQKHGVFLIEDAAHCIEGRYHGRKVGAIGDLTCFSFYVTKNLTTGEGGMITTDNAEWAARLRTLALHGMDAHAYHRFGDKGYRHYQVVEAGYKYNLTDMAAALGLHQLKRIDASWARRDAIWRQYQDAFAGLPVHRPAGDELGTRHARHLYTLVLQEKECGKSRDQLLNFLTKENIGTGVHYTPVHLHPFYRKTFGYTDGDFPEAEWVGNGTISLPFSASLSDDDVEDVIGAVRRFFVD